jgi:seryl-tRNA synthetase
MYELSFFRNNLEDIQKRLATRGFTLDVEAVRQLDQRRRQCLTDSEQAKADRNAQSGEIAKLRKAGENTEGRQAQVRSMPRQTG